LQTVESIEKTINQVIDLKPDRIAFYSYAHVPWTSRAQRLFDESHLPAAEQKILLYLKGKELFLNNGYVDLGMDHFALPTDELYKAWKEGQLFRSFMGYTTRRTGLLLGLGVSSISDTGSAFAQNAKTLHDYYELIGNGKLAIQKGYILSDLDKACKKYILDIACKGYTEFREEDMEILEEYSIPKLKGLEQDGLVTLTPLGVSVTDQGRYFIRNICSAFDLYLAKVDTQKILFSKAV